MGRDSSGCHINEGLGDPLALSGEGASISPTTSAPSGRAPKARVSTLGAPRVQILGDQVVVTGRIYNSGEANAGGSVVLTSMVDSRPVDDARVPLGVPSHTDQVYSHTFHTSIRDGTYSDRIRIDY